nr:aminoglycoside phosphotransferase family protein [Neobacillus sp. Marseille-Q6967]
MDLPKTFIDTIQSVHKEEGRKWLANFNELIRYCEKRWSLKILEPYELSYNFVAKAKLENGKMLVVKLVVPSDIGCKNEVQALKIFNGRKIVKLLDEDVSKGIMILECLTPGKQLAAIENDDEATFIMANVMKQLWITAPLNTDLPNLLDREQEIKKIFNQNPNGLGPISPQMLREAVEIFHYLNRTSSQPYILHGDLHHYNVLSAGTTSWLAIDPKGLIGEREYDVIQFLLNKVPDDNRAEVFQKRIMIFVNELDLEIKRVLLWGYCHSVLSLCWYIEDFGTSNDSVFETIKIFKDFYHSRYGPNDKRSIIGDD